MMFQIKQVMIAAVFVLTCTAFGQAPPSFDVASVKLQPWTGQGSVGIMLRGVTLTAEHVSLRDLVTFAYDLRDVQLSGGPSWADRSGLKLNEAELYEVIGKAAGDTPPSRDEFRRMLQALLADRFQLRIHHQSKDLPVYNLVVEKGGPKFKESAADSKFDAKTTSLGAYAIRIQATGATMQWLVRQIEGYADRPVFDKTGIAGSSFDITLECVVGNLPVGVAINSSRPSIFAALQEQLGLRLEPSMASFDTVVIDRAERPTAN